MKETRLVEEVQELLGAFQQTLQHAQIGPLTKQYEQFWSGEWLSGLPVVVTVGPWECSKKGLRFILENDETIHFSETRLEDKLRFILTYHEQILTRLKASLTEFNALLIRVSTHKQQGLITPPPPSV